MRNLSQVMHQQVFGTLLVLISFSDVYSHWFKKQKVNESIGGRGGHKQKATGT